MCYTQRMKVIRSSDIGNYLYCRRAWMYRQQGFQSENQAELASGTELHRVHGRKVMALGISRTIGLILLLTALVLLVSYCTANWI
jgi:CRISPR/Cas system-associated exonuclease Cas4 (RecB family)